MKKKGEKEMTAILIHDDDDNDELDSVSHASASLTIKSKSLPARNIASSSTTICSLVGPGPIHQPKRKKSKLRLRKQETSSRSLSRNAKTNAANLKFSTEYTTNNLNDLKAVEDYL